MTDEPIRFSLTSNKKVFVTVDMRSGIITHGKDNKANKKLLTIFNAIAQMNDNSDIDSAEEQKLVEMLKAIFSLGDSENIDKDELEWINKLGANNVKNYIETKYNELKDKIDKKYQVADEEPAEPEVDTEKQQARDNIIKGLAERVKVVEGATADGQQVYKETHGTRFFIFNENNEFCEVVEQGGNYVIKDDAAVIKPDDIAEDPQVVAEREAAAQIQAQKAAKQKQMAQVKRRNDQLSSKVDNLVKDLGDVTAQKVEHEVKKGDILWNIAIEQLKKQEVTNPSTQQIINMIAQIKKLNPEMDINNLKIGQKIKLPAAKTEPPKGDDQNFVKKDEKEQIKLIKEMNLEELDKLAGRVVNTGEGDGDLNNLGDDVKKAIVECAVALYKEGKGAPSNLDHIYNIRTLVKWVTFVTDEKQNQVKQKEMVEQILETFFEVKEEGETKTYTFKPTQALNEAQKGRFETVLKEYGNDGMKAAYKAYLDNQKAAGLVTVPEGTPEGVQEIFNEANAFLLEVADMEDKSIQIGRDDDNGYYYCRVDIDGKWINLRKYDDGKVKIRISNNTEVRDIDENGEKYDGAEVEYVIDKDGNIIGRYDNDHTNNVYDGHINSGINSDELLNLVCKIFNYGVKAENFQDVMNYRIGLEVGENLYKQVKGVGSGNAADIINNQITEDNVIGVIDKFNILSYKNDDDQCITKFLMREWGLTTDECRKPATMLLKKAEKLGLQQSTQEYYNLQYAIKHSGYKEIDEAVNALIKKIQEDEQRV